MPTPPPALSPTECANFGRHLGAATRNDGHGVESPAGDNPAKELKIRRFLFDRAFFNVTVTRFLQEQQIPFVMPVMFRGRIPKKRRKLRGLHWIRRQNVGCYLHTLKNKKQSVTVSVYVAYRTHKNRKDGKHKQQKLLFAAWRVSGSPREIRELYRTRFGIETSYRQARQARIYTCTRDPHLRLLFVVVWRFCCGMSGCGFTKPCWLKGTEIR